MFRLNFRPFLYLFFFSVLFSSCKKYVEDNIANHTWNYTATYTITSGTFETIQKNGTYYFDENRTGYQIEDGVQYNFLWGSGSKTIAIEYDNGSYLEYAIAVNEEKKQEWNSEAHYVYPDSSAFTANINLKLSRQ